MGERRVRVRRWLPDDPYPLAEVETLTDPPSRRTATPSPRSRGLCGACWPCGPSSARRSPGSTSVSSDDPVRASFEACGLASFGPLDAQGLLELDDTGARLARLETMLRDEGTMLELRLASS